MEDNLIACLSPAENEAKNKHAWKTIYKYKDSAQYIGPSQTKDTEFGRTDSQETLSETGDEVSSDTDDALTSWYVISSKSKRS